MASRLSRLAPLSAVALSCAACGSAHPDGASGQLVVARRFVALVSSPSWRRAVTLEASGTRSPDPGLIERQLHETIRDLGVRPRGLVRVDGETVRILLRGRQRIRRDNRVFAVRPAAVFVTMTFRREGGRWKIAGFQFSQSSKVLLVRKP